MTWLYRSTSISFSTRTLPAALTCAAAEPGAGHAGAAVRGGKRPPSRQAAGRRARLERAHPPAPASRTLPTSLRPRSTSITCSAHSFSSASRSASSSASASGVLPRRRVPASGLRGGGQGSGGEGWQHAAAAAAAGAALAAGGASRQRRRHRELRRPSSPAGTARRRTRWPPCPAHQHWHQQGGSGTAHGTAPPQARRTCWSPCPARPRGTGSRGCWPR